MPCRTEEIRERRLLVDVCLTSDMESVKRRIAGDGFKPGADSLRALVDTGASASVVSRTIAKKLRLTPLRKVPMMTGAGVVETFVYRVNIHPLVVEEEGVFARHYINVEVTEFSGSDFDVILGLDLIMRGALYVSGGHFTFCI